jgi:SNF2 family DNA or RNA helicase
MIYGETSVDDRAIIEEEYRAGRLRVVICQVVTGGIGLTLIRGYTGVFLTNPYSHESRIQAEDRLHRPGQDGNEEDKVLYYDFVAMCEDQQTVDNTVLEALAAKKNLSDTIIGREIGEVI